MSPIWVPIKSSLCDFLLVINSNLPSILHRFQVTADYMSNFRQQQEGATLSVLVINTNLPPILHSLRVMVKFSLAKGECLTLTLLLGVILCQYRRE